MDNNDDLFLLIKSLNKSEKRYFKVASQAAHRNGQKNYVRFFNYLDSQKKYNENKIVAKQTYIKQLPLTKIRLYELILKSLESYHFDGSLESIINHQLNYIQVLHRKGLYSQCNNLVKKAKKNAYAIEKFELLLEIIRWEESLIRTTSKSKNWEKDFEKLHREKQVLIQQIHNINEYAFITKKVEIKCNTLDAMEARSQKEIRDLQSLLSASLFKNEQQALSLRAKIFYFHTLGLFYVFVGDSEKSHSVQKQLISLVETKPKFLKEITKNYITFINSLCVSLSLHGKYNELPPYIDKMRAVSTTSVAIKAHIFMCSYSLEANMYVQQCQFDKGPALADMVEKNMGWFIPKSTFNFGVSMFYNIAYMYLALGDLNKALYWLNKIINSSLPIRSDVYLVSKMVSLLIFYEKGELELIQHAVRSTYRYLYKRNKVYVFESIVLDFLKSKMPQMKSLKQAVEAFKILKQQLLKLRNDPFEKQMLDYFDFIAWLESKIEGKPFAQIMKEYRKIK